MARWREYGDFFPPSVPRAAKGGIRAQSQHGGFGTSWWAKRWTAVLDSFGLGARMQRGRRYARQGQVLSVEFADGRIHARVQGSRPTPYEVTIQVKVLAKAAWSKVAAAAAAQAVFASKLLAGHMPQEMEEIFREAGFSLFPEAYRDLTTECSCPDWSNPCKHIAAVYYLLGEEFDRDPFLIFRMRGMSREGFLGLLGGMETVQVKVAAVEPLPADPGQFWKGATEIPRQMAPDLRLTEAALPRRLGKFPFWRGGVDLRGFLDDAYVRASAHAAGIFQARTGPQPESPAKAQRLTGRD